MVYFIYLSWKHNVLILFKWIWIEGYFSFIGPKTNFTRSLFSFCEVLIVSRTSENIEVSPAKSFTLHFRLSDKSLIYIKKNNRPRIEAWGTPALIVSLSDFCPFRTTLCCLSNKKDSIKARRSPYTPIHFILYISPSCHTRSKALDISKKTPLFSNEGLASKKAYISWVIEISWCIQESPGMKPDWFGLSNFFYRQVLKKCIKNDSFKQFSTNR